LTYHFNALSLLSANAIMHFFHPIPSIGLASLFLSDKQPSYFVAIILNRKIKITFSKKEYNYE